MNQSYLSNKSQTKKQYLTSSKIKYLEMNNLGLEGYKNDYNFVQRLKLLYPEQESQI